MKGLRPLLSASLLLLSMAAARGVESDPLPVPENSGRAAAVRAYNDGVGGGGGGARKEARPS
jgi:hypothetical protein